MSDEPDFSRPITYDQIESGMRRAMWRLGQQAERLADLEDAQAVADAAFKKAYADARANARANATGRITEAMVDDEATTNTADEYLAWRTAQAQLSAARKAFDAMRARLDALRSLLVNARVAEHG